MYYNRGLSYYYLGKQLHDNGRLPEAQQYYQLSMMIIAPPFVINLTLHVHISTGPEIIICSNNILWHCRMHLKQKSWVWKWMRPTSGYCKNKLTGKEKQKIYLFVYLNQLILSS